MGLFSIGHSNLAAEKFIRLLEAHEIQVLADVRSRPFSRFNPQFNKGRLAAALEAGGIYFRWYGVLGGLDNTSTDSPEFVEAMDELIALAMNQNVAMMCAERHPWECHRASKLGAWLAREKGMSVLHVVENGLLSQAQVAERLNKRAPQRDLPWSGTP